MLCCSCWGVRNRIFLGFMVTWDIAPGHQSLAEGSLHMCTGKVPQETLTHMPEWWPLSYCCRLWWCFKLGWKRPWKEEGEESCVALNSQPQDFRRERGFAALLPNEERRPSVRSVGQSTRQSLGFCLENVMQPVFERREMWLGRWLSE